MDGLECSEISLSEMYFDNEKNRIDSEFFSKKYLKAYQRIKKIPHTTIRDEVEILTDFHANGSYESIASFFKLLDTPDYAYMVRTTDLEKQNYTQDVKYISKQSYDFLEKSKVFGGDVIINKIGSPGRTFLMPNLNRPVSLGMNQFLLRMKKNARVNNILLFVFLNSSVGKLIIERKINGTVPLTIDKEAIRSIYLPIFSNIIIDKIVAVIKKINDFQMLAEKIYNQAIDVLNDSFCLTFNDSFAPNIKSFTSSFLKSGRLDAEYYQPKFDELFRMLKKYNCKKLGGEDGLATIMKSIEPGSEYYQDEGIPFVRVSDIDKFGISKPEIKIPSNIVKDIETLYPKKDTILLSKDGSVGLAYKVEEDLNVVTSGALLHLTIKNTNEVLPDYLTLVLNSPIVQLQAERDCNGAIIQHWKPSEIENVTIPILDIDIQKEIAEKVQESFKLRKESKNLLDNAIKAIEMAIETDENTAIQWLKTQN